MQEVMAPAKACVEVDGLSGVRYKARDGRYQMSDQDARALIRAGGFRPSLSGGRIHGVGYRCLECGHGSWFRICGKCSSECEKS